MIGQFPIAMPTRVLLYQHMANLSHIRQAVLLPFGTRQPTCRSVSSNTLKTYVQLRYLQITGLSQLVDVTGQSLPMVYLTLL